jgi:hypothetical protein
MTVIEGGLISLEYAREGLNFKTADAVRDADLTSYVQAATAVIESIVGPVAPVSRTRLFDGGGAAVVLPERASAVTSVTESGDATTDFVFDSFANIIYAGVPAGSREFADGIGSVVVVYTVGYATVPQTLQLAARELVRHWWQQGKQANRPAFGEAAEPSGPPMGFAVPKRVVELCQPFIVVAGFS